MTTSLTLKHFQTCSLWLLITPQKDKTAPSWRAAWKLPEMTKQNLSKQPNKPQSTSMVFGFLVSNTVGTALWYPYNIFLILNSEVNSAISAAKGNAERLTENKLNWKTLIPMVKNKQHQIFNVLWPNLQEFSFFSENHQVLHLLYVIGSADRI